MQIFQLRAALRLFGAAVLSLASQSVDPVSCFSRNGVASTFQGALTDGPVMPSPEDHPTNVSLPQDPFQNHKPPPDKLTGSGPLREKTQIMDISQDADTLHKSDLQGQRTGLRPNGWSDTSSKLSTAPVEAAAASPGASAVSVKSDASTAVSSVSSSADGYSHPSSHRERKQGISEHMFYGFPEANSVGGSLLHEDVETHAPPSGSPSVWTWNPLHSGQEPTEAEKLEHNGLPEDFVGIPMLDKAAEEHIEQAEDVAAGAGAGEALAGEEGSTPLPSRETDSDQVAEEEQRGSSRRSGSGKYQRWLEQRVGESRDGRSTGAESPSSSSQDNDGQVRQNPNSPSPSTSPQAPEAATLRGTVSESESGSIDRWPTTDSSNSSGGDDKSRTGDSIIDSRYTRKNGSRRKRRPGHEALWHAGWRSLDSRLGHTTRGQFGHSRSTSPSATSWELNEASEDSGDTAWQPLSPRGGLSDSQRAAGLEAEDSLGLKTECVLEVGGVRIDASYLDSACTGPVHVEYQKKQGRFLERRLLLSNTTGQPLTVVMKTVNAKFKASTPSHSNSYYRGFSGPASFLQEQDGEDATAAAEAAAKSADYVTSILKQMRRHRRKLPNSPLDLVVCFASPLDGNSEKNEKQTKGEALSFMQTSAGATRIMQTCEDLFSVLKDRRDFSCEILEAVDVIILQFPPTADLSDKGEVQMVLSKLLLLEGRSILFFELAKPTSLQMVPAGERLPEPPKGLMERWAFMQAKEALQAQCSAEETARTRLLSEDEDSPVSARVPQDPDLEKRLWGMFSAHCVHAWMHGEKGHRDIVVAVIDSGVARHSDLDENIWHNPLETIDGQDDDNNGFIDDTEGWNFADDSNRVVDTNGHGTHVAGTVGGVANNRDIVGCAPLVSLMKIQQFGSSGTGSIGDAVRGLAYAMVKGVSVINNSWGAPETTASLQLLIERSRHMRGGLGILIVNAAGNSSSNNDFQPFYPANFDYSNTISVGAYDADGNLASFSNYGKNSVSLLAPGDRIYSTYLDDGFAFLSGTSMAAPHVSGVGALVFGVFKKANSDVTAAEVKDIIKATVQPLKSAQQTTQWGGAVDAAAAVLMARMGGMWMQMKCTDMIVDLEAEEKYASTLYWRGYAEGTYRADIKVEVYSKEGNLLGTALIPIMLNSSTTPATNKPSDTEAANAFSSYAKERDHQTPLCDVQLGYKGSLEDEGWSGLKIAAVSLGCVAGALLLTIGGFLLYSRLYAHRVP